VMSSPPPMRGLTPAAVPTIASRTTRTALDVTRPQRPRRFLLARDGVDGARTAPAASWSTGLATRVWR
jgi:hypothetical protein